MDISFLAWALESTYLEPSRRRHFALLYFLPSGSISDAYKVLRSKSTALAPKYMIRRESARSWNAHALLLKGELLTSALKSASKL